MNTNIQIPTDYIRLNKNEIDLATAYVHAMTKIYNTTEKEQLNFRGYKTVSSFMVPESGNEWNEFPPIKWFDGRSEENVVAWIEIARYLYHNIPYNLYISEEGAYATQIETLELNRDTNKIELCEVVPDIDGSNIVIGPTVMDEASLKSRLEKCLTEDYSKYGISQRVVDEEIKYITKSLEEKGIILDLDTERERD